MKLIKKKWGILENKDVHLFIVEDPNTGFKVEISELGASIVSVQVPDNKGKIDAITYGHEDPKTYIESPGYMGATIGRVTNRIQNGHFELDGTIYKLTKNYKNIHQLHGGFKGFDKRLWMHIEEETFIKNKDIRISFQYLSKEREEGYPGNLLTKISYRIRPMVLEWEFHATTDKKTIVNLTNHTYWNLNGTHTMIDDLKIALYAKKYCVVNDDLIPTGEIKEFPINLTKLQDFKTIFKRFGDVDHNFFLENYLYENSALDVFPATMLYSPKTGRKMTVETSEPCLQVYTGNFMEHLTSYGTPCKKHNAVCLETQRVPNAINMLKFRESVILKPNEVYRHRTRHLFNVMK
ncbi:MAG: galactose mutarotase [Candidatus Lokiarchaeota archaeon]|nr:galactose mutarotase [Candidatus Lokiarchaeota archaeon]